MSFSSFLRRILPKEDKFYDVLEQQATVARKAAETLVSFKDGATALQVQDRVQALEHEGDKLNHGMIEDLGKTFATPIDRDDLQKLSKRIDDITDYANAAARACVLFGVEKPTRPMLLLAETLLKCCRQIDTAVPRLRSQDYRGIIEDSRAITQLEKDADTVYRNELSRMFHDTSVDAKTILREREVLEDLEAAVNHCEQVADLLMAVAVKHA